MIKMIATDLDGTFFHDDKSFSDEFYDIFDKLKDKDIKFVVATGNQYELVKERFSKIKDDIIYLVENGNKIVYQNQILLKKTLKEEDKNQILNCLLAFEDLMIVYCGVKHAYIHKRFKDKEDFIKMFYRNYQFIDNYEDIDDEVLKFSIADFQNHPYQYVQLIKQDISRNIQVITTGHQWFDIFYKDINKGTGMIFLQDYFHIDRKDCMAFGDQLNDYDLLKSCEESYAMANAHQDIKQIAKYITKSNEEDGVLTIIRELV